MNNLKYNHLKKIIKSNYNLIITIIIPFLFTSYGQAQKQTYVVKVAGVENIADAKDMTDYIRPLFNTTDIPFAFFPSFNAMNKQFEFKSDIVVNENEVQQTLAKFGLTLVYFERTTTNINLENTKQ